VCRKYYAKLHGVSVKKLKGAMTVVKHGGRASVLRSTERRKQVFFFFKTGFLFSPQAENFPPSEGNLSETSGRKKKTEK
jgi:hypothetical protein